MNQKSIQIDLDGYVMFDGVRVSDEAFGRDILLHLFPREDLIYTKSAGQEILVEAFNEPLIVLNIKKDVGTLWTFQMPYDFSLPFDLSNLRMDDWDRFCGHFENGIPFVFSRSAQAEFFNMLEDYTDTSIVIDGTEIELESKYKNSYKISSLEFWSEFYKNKDTPWDLEAASPVLKQAILQLKLPRQRILVLGAGKGHDAVEFARAGHVVTAVDFSPQALSEYKNIYRDVKDLNYIVSDAFQLPKEMNQSFDLVFDHTFFCAVEPKRRKEAVHLWKRMLTPQGHLLSIFFIMNRVEGPPFGASEWEIHELLKKDFNFLYWTRTKASVPRRQNKELLVYASKK